ncbi:transient receptor potential protein-like [Planococcus citri]|uniref:transient receptor potential protein-like n=1 Tax=Planococcus citri TaxID=170843 RepID=UPI0031F9BB8D
MGKKDKQKTDGAKSNGSLTNSRKRGSKLRSSLLLSQLASPHYSLTQVEKIFLLHAERGDCASVQKIIDQYKDKPPEFNINCLDPLNRSALIIGIEKENIDLINLLLEAGIQVKDALLHAINEEYVDGVEILLQWEEKSHIEGQPYSWESVDKSSSGFTIDITPVILAAHKNNYEILKLLLDRGATLPVTHDVRCGCDECVSSKEQDSLRHSQSRINAYKALTSPSLICLSSRDPLLTSIELYAELKRLELTEAEFRVEYNAMRHTVQTFATALLDHARTSSELEIMLNYDPEGDPWEPNDRQTLARLKLAIKYKLKMFVAHPNVQQLLASIWYEGLPGFRRKNMFYQLLGVLQIAFSFVPHSIAYMICPSSSYGGFLRKPFVKFICHSASYGFFLGLLALASQRVESLCYELLFQDFATEWTRKERGAPPGIIESMIIVYIISLVWKEMKALYVDGLFEYLNDLWNILDYISNVFYITWIFLRFTAFYVVSLEYSQGFDPWYPRDQWDKFDPHMLSECAFASGMILSFMKLVNIFSINPHLGPLQISLGRMIIDIIKFFFIYTLVLFAFGCGLNQLLWYFAGLEEAKCYHNNDGIPDFEDADKACTIWRRFANLFETSQSLFWASFGLVDLTAFDLTGIKSFTRFWGLLIFGCYSAINIIVLLNMLIAMMSNSYQIISARADMEWKFARSKLFISFFEDGDTVPPPFNLFPTFKNIEHLFSYKKNKKTASKTRKMEINREKADLRYDIIMQLLIRRYVTVEQKKMEEFSVTEDDIAEVRHDISTLRFELMDVFSQNNFKVPKISRHEITPAQGKKERIMERRIIKDFQIGIVEGVVNEIISTEKVTKNIFGKIAKAIGRADSKKRDWNALVRHSSIVHDPIGSTSEAERKLRQQSVRRYILEHQGPSLMDMDPEKLVEYNPQLAEINPTARIAYAKFKMSLIKQEYEGIRGVSMDEGLLDQAGSLTPKGSQYRRQDSIIRPRPKSSSMKLRDAEPGKLKSEGIVPALQGKHRESLLHSSIKEEAPSTSRAAKPSAPSEAKGEKPKKKDEVVLTVEHHPHPPPPPTFVKGKPRDGRWL